MAGIGFGIQLPIQAQSTLFAQDWEAVASTAELSAVAQAADQAGFSYIAVCDHIAVPRDRAETMGTTWWDTVATLSYLAAVTERVKLLSHIACVVYRHPLQTAKQWSTLDTLSGGRVVLGVGAGHVEDEFRALGVDFHRRGALLDEVIDGLRVAFADEFSSHEGPTWAWREMGQRPRPVQSEIPIWVAGSSPAAIRRAATRGDGWLPQGPPEMGMKAAIDQLHELRAGAGRSDQPFSVGGLSGPLTGTAGKQISYLQTLVDAGVDQIQVAFPSRDHVELCDTITAFGREVRPAFDGAPADA